MPESGAIDQPVPVPAGAESAEPWEDGERFVRGAQHHVIDTPRGFYVSTSCIQQLDGSIEEPFVYLSSPEHLNTDQARELAALLIKLAAQVDGWVQ